MIKNTHTDAQTKYDVKEKHISFGAIVHIVARAVGASTWTERVGTQQWHLHPTVFISAHNGAGLHLHGPERLQFSALGEKRGVIKKKKRPFQRLSQHQMPGWLQRVGRQTQEIQFLSSIQGGERKSREAFTSAAERTETMRSSLQWSHVYGSSEVDLI